MATGRQNIRNSKERAGIVPFPFFCLVLCLFPLCFRLSVASAQEYKTVELPAAPPANSEESQKWNFSGILRNLLLECMKSEYVDDREWRGTVERFDGFRVRGARISKREREVPHGIWHRYRVNLIQPEKYFDVQVAQLAPVESGAIPFSILINLKARCEATFVWWAYGVKGVNGTADSDARLQLHLLLETSPRIAFSFENPLPRVELRPKVKQVELKLKDLDTHRIGILGRDAAKVLGDGSKKAVESLIKLQEKRIRDQLQKSLDQVGA